MRSLWTTFIMAFYIGRNLPPPLPPAGILVIIRPLSMIPKGRKSPVMRTTCPSANLICWNCTLTLSTFHWSMVLHRNDCAPPSLLCSKRIREVCASNICGLYTYLKQIIIFAWSACGAAAWYIMEKILAHLEISRMAHGPVDKLSMLFIRKRWQMICHIFFAHPLQCLTMMLLGAMTALSLLFWPSLLYVLACLESHVTCRWWLWHWWNTLSKQCMVYLRNPINQHNLILYLVLDTHCHGPSCYVLCWSMVGSTVQTKCRFLHRWYLHQSQWCYTWWAITLDRDVCIDAISGSDLGVTFIQLGWCLGTSQMILVSDVLGVGQRQAKSGSKCSYAGDDCSHARPHSQLHSYWLFGGMGSMAYPCHMSCPRQ